MLRRATNGARLLAVAAASCFLLSIPAASAADEFNADTPIVAPLPGAERDIPRAITLVARAELAKGVREAPRGSDNSSEIARYRAALVPRPRPAAWCAFFASWVTRTAGAPLGRHGDGIASAAGVRSWAQRTGRWRHSPLPGDVAVFSGHVGIVTSVDGSRMTTIDGNWSDRVSQVSRSRGQALGFARLAAGSHLIGR
jgi:hypothetical protein